MSNFIKPIILSFSIFAYEVSHSAYASASASASASAVAELPDQDVAMSEGSASVATGKSFLEVLPVGVLHSIIHRLPQKDQSSLAQTSHTLGPHAMIPMVQSDPRKFHTRQWVHFVPEPVQKIRTSQDHTQHTVDSYFFNLAMDNIESSILVRNYLASSLVKGRVGHTMQIQNTNCCAMTI